MSQVITPAPSPGPSAPSNVVLPAQPAPDASTANRLASASATVRQYLSGSPGRLRITSAVAVLAALVVALGGGAALRERSSALDEARAAAAHLVLVQGVQIRLAQADADVTNAFLRFGLEPVAQQLDYSSSIKVASRDLALAASGSPEDAKSLGAANAALTLYTNYIGSARANNRLGKPVGANYLTTASSLLRQDVLPQLEALADADTKKIDSAYSRAGRASWWLALVAIAGLGVLISAQVYLARHTRRILNVPLVAATAGVLIGLIVAAGSMALAQSKANSVRDSELATVKNLSNSRVAAFDAKSTESLTLINRGSGTQADPVWTKLMKEATAALPTSDTTAARALSGYATLHTEKINAADVGGRWDEAVGLATATGTSSANARFAIYAQETGSELTAKAAAVSSGLGSAGNLLLPAGILVVLVGLIAAFGAWLGVSLRLDEYR